MTTPISLESPSVLSLKAEARALRDDRAAKHRPLSHSQALETIARAHGYRDWNTACASLPDRPAAPDPATCPVAVGGRAAGLYLGRPFAGQVLSVTAIGGGQYFRLAIHFDDPVNVTPQMQHLEVFRQRIHARIDRHGRSPERTGNGQRQLVLDLGA